MPSARGISKNNRVQDILRDEDSNQQIVRAPPPRSHGAGNPSASTVPNGDDSKFSGDKSGKPSVKPHFRTTDDAEPGSSKSNEIEFSGETVFYKSVLDGEESEAHHGNVYRDPPQWLVEKWMRYGKPDHTMHFRPLVKGKGAKAHDGDKWNFDGDEVDEEDEQEGGLS